MQIRAAGFDGLWGEKNYIEAAPETLHFVAQHILEGSFRVTCWVHSSYDGSNVTKVVCGAADSAQQHEIHLFNPVGVHFDPLWPSQ